MMMRYSLRSTNHCRLLRWIPFQADYFKELQNMALGLRKQMLITLRDEKLIHFQNTVARCKNLAKQRESSKKQEKPHCVKEKENEANPGDCKEAHKGSKARKKKNMKWRKKKGGANASAAT